MGKNFDGEKKSSVKKHIGKYKLMLKEKSMSYFDVEEFEDIVEYFINKEKITEAQNALKYALNLHPGAFSLLLKQAQVYVESEKTEKALAVLGKLKAIHPEEPEIYFWLGMVEISKKNFEAAENDFAKLLKFMKEDDEEILLLVAFSYIQQGEFKRALLYLKKAYSINQKNSYVLYDLAYCYEQIKDYEKSAINYQKYLEENPFEANVWYNLGVIFTNLGENEKAIDAYDFSIAIKPDFSHSLYNKAILLENDNKNEEAIDVYKDFLKIEKNSIEGLNGLATCYRKLEEYKLAEETYKIALEKDKNNIDTLYGIAAVSALTDQNLEGLNYIIRVLRIEKTNPDVHYLAAKIFSRLGYFERSEESFIKALTLMPDNPKFWVSFSELFYETDVQKSIELLDEAIKIIPDNAEIMYLLAEYSFYAKNNEKASEYLKQAVALDKELLNDFLQKCPSAVNNKEVKLITQSI